MNALVLRCTFVAHSYQGVRLTQERKEELDWPPAPARLHQALMAAALTGIPKGLEERLAKAALGALRWLEQQPAPEIAASPLSEEQSPDRPASTRFRTAIPQNNPAKTDLTRTSILLAQPLPRRAVGRSRCPLTVVYIWPLENPAARQSAQEHIPVLRDLAAQVRYLGRAEDQIEAQIGPADVSTSRGEEETWWPTNRLPEVELLVAKSDTTNDLIRNHAQVLPARTRRSPASRFLRRQGYMREAATGLLPIHVSLFQLVPVTDDPDDLPLSCDPESAGVWRSQIRQRAVDFALDLERWDQPELARELISGHPPGQEKPTDQPHLAFVPLPSISSHGKADGRVRRFALLGYSAAAIEAEAREVYRVLCASLNGEVIQLGASEFQLTLLQGRPERDKVWSQFMRSSRVWRSVTPVALARGFTVPTHSPDGSRRLSTSERHLRKLTEWTALLRSSLRHICLPEDIVASCSLTLTPSPLVPSTCRAERYRRPGESAVLTHARMEFATPVKGPLIVGDRRYQGYGLFLPL
ncbi:MAG: type I-U CRISPR-associated protein Cas5/Cas6 [Acidobacteria bacterium]|nr:type I-U CRISPR-associated protein Cas5/Cas6 [Acidobacteriota bacterium]